MSGQCCTEAVVYQATVTNNNYTVIETYVGLTQNQSKYRYNNHTASFKNISRQNSTELSKYIWKLKDNKIAYEIKWKILARAQPCNKQSPLCKLCLLEKYFIICKPHLASVNSRNEIVTTCRYARKLLLENVT